MSANAGPSLAYAGETLYTVARRFPRAGATLTLPAALSVVGAGRGWCGVFSVALSSDSRGKFRGEWRGGKDVGGVWDCGTGCDGGGWSQEVGLDAGVETDQTPLAVDVPQQASQVLDRAGQKHDVVPRQQEGRHLRQLLDARTVRVRHHLADREHVLAHTSLQ